MPSFDVISRFALPDAHFRSVNTAVGCASALGTRSPRFVLSAPGQKPRSTWRCYILSVCIYRNYYSRGEGGDLNQPHCMLSHDLINKMFVIVAHCDELERLIPSPGCLDHTSKIREQAQAVSALLRSPDCEECDRPQGAR
jgi:hypothetical protein